MNFNIRPYHPSDLSFFRSK